MSLRRQILELQRERQKRLLRDLRLRADLKWQFAHVLMLAQVADDVVSLAGRLFGGRRPRRSRGR